MNKLFAVRGETSIIALVKAIDKEKALHKFAENQIHDRKFREFMDHSGCFSLGGLLENHFAEDDKFNEFELQEMSRSEREKCIDSLIKKKVYCFWGNSPEIAEEYLRELKKEFANEPHSFSESFYIETLKNHILNNRWYEEFEIIEIDYSKDYQVIFMEKYRDAEA